MTPQSATQHERQLSGGGIAQAALPTVALPVRAIAEAPPLAVPAAPGLAGRLRPRLRRASTQRRLLASADAVSSLAALVAVSAAFGHGQTSPLLLLWLPLTVGLFKIAGLYDRDDMRLRALDARRDAAAAAARRACALLASRSPRRPRGRRARSTAGGSPGCGSGSSSRCSSAGARSRAMAGRRGMLPRRALPGDRRAASAPSGSARSSSRADRARNVVACAAAGGRGRADDRWTPTTPSRRLVAELKRRPDHHRAGRPTTAGRSRS